MNRPISEKPIIALGPWLTSPAGSYVRRAFTSFYTLRNRGGFLTP